MSSNTNWQKNSAMKIYTDTYFNSKFALTVEGVQELANYIIDPGFVSSVFQNPSDWLSSLVLYPFNITYAYGSSGYLQVASFETDIPCTTMDSQYGWFNMGEAFIPRTFNNFADYNGYTKIEVWLPYYGFVSVEPNDVVGKYLEFTLSIDFGSGQAVYYIGVSDTSILPLPNYPQWAANQFTDVRILSAHTFQLGYPIPLGTTNTAEVYRNILMGAVKASASAIGAYAASSVGGAVASTKTTSVKTVRNPKTNRQITQSKQTRESVTDTSAYLKGKATTEIFDYSADALSSMHFGGHSDVTNNPALLCNGSDSVKVIIYTPKLKSIDSNYRHLYGVPLGESKVLSTLSGYTEISEVHLESSSFGTATETELAMINEKLLNGVILP